MCIISPLPPTIPFGAMAPPLPLVFSFVIFIENNENLKHGGVSLQLFRQKCGFQGILCMALLVFASYRQNVMQFYQIVFAFSPNESIQFRAYRLVCCIPKGEMIKMGIHEPSRYYFSPFSSLFFICLLLSQLDLLLFE